MDQLPELLTAKQVSAALGVSRYTLNAWRREGKHLAFIHFGGGIRYHRTEVERFLREGTHTPRPNSTRSPTNDT